MRIAALADFHCNAASHEGVRPLFDQIAQNADVVVLCGDLIDYGLPEEALLLAKQIAGLKIPVLAVLGNHEFESGKQDVEAWGYRDARQQPEGRMTPEEAASWTDQGAKSGQ